MEPEFDLAPDVTDLRTAKEIIAALRAQVRQLIEDQEPLPGEHTVFLSADAEERVLWLYKARKLVGDQSLTMCFKEAFQGFVEGAIEAFFEMAQLDASPSGPTQYPPMA
jgi:hypothetical protein